MNLGYGLYQEQMQRLVMTQQMKQAIELLQCNALELVEKLAELADSNPLAEVEPPPALWQEPWWRTAPGAGGVRRDAAGVPFEQVVAAEDTLSQALVRQLRLMPAPRHILRCAEYLAGCLDESGYLREPEDALCEVLGVPREVFDEALALLQSCDPPGIGARHLRECLRLQLDRVPAGRREMVRILIDHHLEAVAAGKLAAIAKQLHTSPAEVQAAVDELRRLNPRPGYAYKAGRPEYVVPDLLVRRDGSRYIVLHNDHAEPSLRISPHYHRMLARAEDEETRQYLVKKLHAVQWFARCLEQRRVTLYRVGEAIVEYQRAFFDHGVAALRPLTLRQVGEALGLHESTISRATRGKYMLTPRGLFEMKYFFTAEVAAAGGSTSAGAVKFAIRRLIDTEDPQRPLSDEALARRLQDEGMYISRRTVAKYREEMQIPPSWRRRRFAE
ncbi:RNA polymerase factor sigma-54 [Alicyclobacillus macrosporangiidus]|uniref:RNA polymerase factor sigma-54 n=1 Tax=Alicyclobacillus macrosporangiidus TaxID=392015 RepID=UPI000495D4D6|nr:RNA polymerase factor sigma-54 [Alicyclobacillus macrosporangiidus]